jgi:hypothetical protein
MGGESLPRQWQGVLILVTGDKDLLSVAADTSLPVLAPRAFWKLLQRQPG